MKKNPVIANKYGQSFGPSLYRGFTVYGKPVALTTGQIFFQRIALSTFQTIGGLDHDHFSRARVHFNVCVSRI